MCNHSSSITYVEIRHADFVHLYEALMPDVVDHFGEFL